MPLASTTTAWGELIQHGAAPVALRADTTAVGHGFVVAWYPGAPCTSSAPQDTHRRLQRPHFTISLVDGQPSIATHTTDWRGYGTFVNSERLARGKSVDLANGDQLSFHTLGEHLGFTLRLNRPKDDLASGDLTGAPVAATTSSTSRHTAVIDVDMHAAESLRSSSRSKSEASFHVPFCDV